MTTDIDKCECGADRATTDPDLPACASYNCRAVVAKRKAEQAQRDRTAPTCAQWEHAYGHSSKLSFVVRVF